MSKHADYKKIERKLLALGFKHVRNSGNAHAQFRHCVITAFKLSVPCTPKSTGALRNPVKKAELFNALLDAGFEYAGMCQQNILLRHKKATKKIVTIPARPRSTATLQRALSIAEEIVQSLKEKNTRREFNSKSERKAYRKSLWKNTLTRTFHR